MTLPASLEGRERARLFCALRLPDAAVDVLSEWQAGHMEGGRVVPREHLHLTLAFLGHRPVGELAAITGALREAASAPLQRSTSRRQRLQAAFDRLAQRLVAQL